MSTISSPCPCHSLKNFSECCEPYLLNQSLPQTPEALMRSRYTAYSQRNISYILETMQGPALKNFNPAEALKWTREVQWLDLKIISASTVTAHTDIGFVEFIASFIHQDQRQIMHERSEFQRLRGRWYYITGRIPKIDRNQPCYCGSGKKFKNCCNK